LTGHYLDRGIPRRILGGHGNTRGISKATIKPEVTVWVRKNDGREQANIIIAKVGGPY